MLSRRSFSKSILAAPWILRAQQGALKARVKIDTERTIGDIDPKLYGNFIEHLGRCIYGGVFDEKSSLSDTRTVSAAMFWMRPGSWMSRCSAGRAGTFRPIITGAMASARATSALRGSKWRGVPWKAIASEPTSS